MSHRPSRNAWFALLSSLLLLALGLGLFVVELHSRATWAEQTLRELEPRYARMLGLQGGRDRFAAASAELAERLDEQAYPPELEPSRVGADVQQKLRALAEAAGLSVISSRIGAVEAQPGFQVVPVALVLEGDMQALELMLSGLAGLRPLLHPRSLGLSAVVRRDQAVPLLRADLSIAALRLGV